MNGPFTESRDKRGNWRPPDLIQLPPLCAWPPQPVGVLKWLFGYPGYFLPWGVLYMALPLITWSYLTPDLEQMRRLEFGWIALVLLRNVVLLCLVVGALHVRLFVQRAQGTRYKYSDKWLATGNPAFLFGNQLLDNLYWTFVSAVPIWTAYEVLTLWMYANHFIPSVSWTEHPLYLGLFFALIPILRDVHFYLIHRLIHWPPLYRRVHYLHHNNVNVGPFTGLSMHPVEHLLYFSGIVLHWIVPSHPVLALYHIQHAALGAAQGHLGFERIEFGGGIAVRTDDHFHYLHHRHFECNYGGDGMIPIDKWCGTFHDGSDAATLTMNRRFQKTRRRG